MNQSITSERRSAFRQGAAINRIIFAGGVAGCLDFAFAISIWATRGVPPIAIPQSVASGLLGPVAFKEGLGAVVLGTFLHLAMTTLMAAAYHKAAPPAARSRPFVAGPAYGAVIWTVMNKVVVPLSAAPLTPPPLMIALADLAAHMMLVGLPIALILRCDRPSGPAR